MNQAEQVQEMIVTAALCILMKRTETKELIVTPEELKEELSKVTIRMELMTPSHPATSNVKLSVVTLEEAQNLLKSMNKKR